MYTILIIPLVAGISAQILKLIIDAFKGKFTWGDLTSYGGMPSAHTAFVISLAAAVGYFEGWESTYFAITVVLAILVISNATGMRRQLGKHAKTLNKHFAQLTGEQNHQFEHLTERLGHRPVEILGGAVVGIVVPLLFIYLG